MPVPIDLPAGRPAVCQRGRCRTAGCRATAPALSSMSLGRPMSDEAIRDLAHRAGIAVEWHDVTGRPQDRRARGAAPHARGAWPALRHARRSAGQPQAAAAQIHRAGAAAADHRDGGPADRLDVGANEPVGARLSLEAGGTQRRPALAGARTAAHAGGQRARLPPAADRRSRDRAGGGADALPHDRRCGAGCAAVGHRGAGLFAASRRRRWHRRRCGIAALAEAAGARGADALALSPMHALFAADPSRFGPYSPSTRLFLNPLHASAGAGVRRGARGRQRCAPKGWARRSRDWKRCR